MDRSPARQLWEDGQGERGRPAPKALELQALQAGGHHAGCVGGVTTSLAVAPRREGRGQPAMSAAPTGGLCLMWVWEMLGPLLEGAWRPVNHAHLYIKSLGFSSDSWGLCPCRVGSAE